MRLAFRKMHGAGNDFIVADDFGGRFPAADQAWIRRICAAHSGIGAEGLILLQPANGADFRMRFFNPDGREAEMCGNGIRCAARFAFDFGIAGKEMSIRTKAGLLRAVVSKSGVKVAMPPPSAIRLDIRVAVGRRRFVCHFANTGVPHAVIATSNLEGVDLRAIGPVLRRHRAFGPRGANVDFMRITGPGSLEMRTYERGVEAETSACGTGATACAVIASLLKKVAPPVSVKCRSGDVLEIDFRLNAGLPADVSLTGPAVTVFEGQISYP